MRRALIVLGLLLVVVLALRLFVGSGPAYLTVPQAQAALEQHPARWVGRVVYLRGWSTSTVGQGCGLPRPGAAPPPLRPTTCVKVWAFLTARPSYASIGAFPILLRRGGYDPYQMDIPVVSGLLLRSIPGIGPALAPWGGSHLLHVRLTLTPGTCTTAALSCPGGVEVP